MARLKGTVQFEGGLGGVNAYRPAGDDASKGVILRKNGGPDAKQIHTDPAFAVVRLNNGDFGTCSSGSKSIRIAIAPVKHMADYNIAPKLLSLCKHIQRMDTTHEKGAQTVLFSKYGNYLTGFNLNRQYLFDSVMRHTITATVDRSNASAVIQIPELNPDVSVVLPWTAQLYRFVFSLGVVLDKWTATRMHHQIAPVTYTTPWYIAQQTIPGELITLQLPDQQLSDEKCLVVAVGIEAGTMISDAVIERVKNRCCAKILATG